MSNEGVSMIENPFGDAERQVLQGMVESAPGIRELYEKLGELAQLQILPSSEAEFFVVQQELVGQLIDSINAVGMTLPVMNEHFEVLSDAYGIRSTVDRLYAELRAIHGTSE